MQRKMLAAAALILTLAGGAAKADPVEAAFVTLGPDGAAIARVMTRASACPVLAVDGKAMPMQVRAEPGTEPLRPTRSTPENSKPSAFPVLVCDAALPGGARRASVEGRPLPVPQATARRIVVIGDTGCRLKASDDAWQACNDPAAYPFARIAAKAAAMHPDLVIHVGDYLYRENPCTAGHPGCTGSPWGYGWDAWDADFFVPAAPLLAAAPWAVVRGNHENCARAGQGWWRLLDPRPLLPGRDCNDPANDAAGDASSAYAVPLGEGAQLVVMDLAAIGTDPLPEGDPRHAQIAAVARQLAGFARGAGFTFAADHYPFFGATAKEKHGGVAVKLGNPALQAGFAAAGYPDGPAGVDVLLAGHIHLWEQLDFGGRQPSQFVAGFSGTQEDLVPLPAQLPGDAGAKAGLKVERFSAIVDRFGFMVLDRAGPARWSATVYSVEGKILRRCQIDGRRSRCIWR